MDKNTISLQVDVTLDNDNMKENSMTIDDIKKQLTFVSDDVLDGYVLTRNSKDNIEKFYIENVSIK